MAVVYLHIGAMKTGTSYLQRMLVENRERLRGDGVLLPGRGGWADQVAAVRDVLNVRPRGRFGKAARGSWERLVEEISGWAGRASVVSMEFLSFAGPAEVRKIVDSLAPAEVRVVLTARDLARAIPAAWQETTQNRRTWKWEYYLDKAMGESPANTDAGRHFWQQQDIPGMLRTWGESVPADRIFLVTLPPPGSGPHLLWRRFCTVLEIDSAEYELEPRGKNESLGAASAELMRRINSVSRERVPTWPAYAEILKHGLAKRALAERRPTESRVGLPVAYHEYVADRAKRLVEEIERFGPRVVGDLGDVLPARIDEGAQPGDLTDGELLDAAVDGIARFAAHMYADLDEVRTERDRALTRVRQLETGTPRQLLKRAAVRLGERHRAGRAALAVYRARRRSG